MLVLMRRDNERIVIGRDGAISIVVVAARDGRVALGIDAPPNTPVHREEVYRRIQRDEEARP